MLDDNEYAELKELLADAEKCHRLSAWETAFLGSIRRGFALYGADLDLSAKQRQTLKIIEEKVYA